MEVLAGSFVRERPERLIGDRAYDTHPADRFCVVVRDEAGEELLAAGESTTDAAAARTGESAWIWTTADLSPFAARTVDVGFLAKTDGKRHTTLFVVDAALMEE